MRPEELRDLVFTSLDDDKAENILVIDLNGKTALADYMIIASGRSTRHVTTLSEKLIERIKESGACIPRAEGLEHGDWVLIDTPDVIVHVFRPEVREFYNLEKMWMSIGNEGAADQLVRGRV